MRRRLTAKPARTEKTALALRMVALALAWAFSSAAGLVPVLAVALTVLTGIPPAVALAVAIAVGLVLALAASLTATFAVAAVAKVIRSAEEGAEPISGGHGGDGSTP